MLKKEAKGSRFTYSLTTMALKIADISVCGLKMQREREREREREKGRTANLRLFYFDDEDHTRKRRRTQNKPKFWSKTVNSAIC